MTESREIAKSRKRGALLALFSAVYIAAMLACLSHWGSPDPWSRLDRFSGGYIVLSVVWLVVSLRFLSRAVGASQAAKELAGSTFDPRLTKFISTLSLLELWVFFDYGHLCLATALERPVLQWLGLALSLAGALWLVWTDRFLLAHFAAGMDHRRVITAGPYRFVRHPRYLALMVSRLAFALALASALAWGFFIVWMIVILRRIRLEEAHLGSVFGPDYIAYAARTARVVPGLY
jgi:protein-S-isoprenylcysteine O-methyltransferase Ste14